MEKRSVIIDPLEEVHWERVKDIYESGIATGNATFETFAPDWEKWNRSHRRFPRLVASLNNLVVGWAALSNVSDRCVYKGVAEVSVYVEETHRNSGIGKILLSELILESEKIGIWTLQSSIFEQNHASLNLHQSLGFRVVGYRERIGKLNGEWKDNILLERRSRTVGI